MPGVNHQPICEIYADNAATTKPSPAAVAAMTRCLTEHYGNPSSLHRCGQDAATTLLLARESIAALLRCSPRELYFTASGSEADNQALRTGAAWGAAQGKRHIVSTAFEHPAVLRTLEQLQTEGFAVTLVPPRTDGLIYTEDIAAALQPDTCLVSVMLVNNEIGTLQPVADIGALCRARGVLMHTDAVQAVGQLPVDLAVLPIDLLSFSGHKFHGPRGVGGLYVRRGLPPARLIFGGGQERGVRAGTENLPAIAGMEAALQEAVSRLPQTEPAIAALREQLIDGLAKLPGAHLTGDRRLRAGGIVHFCFEGAESETLLLLLDEMGICASAGSACSSGALQASHVLRSMWIPEPLARGALRLSIGADTTPKQINTIIQAVGDAVARLRKENR